MMSAGDCVLGLTACVAPSTAARSSASSRKSTTVVIERGPLRAVTSWTRTPMKPQPMIATSSPSAGAAASTALMTQASGSATAGKVTSGAMGTQCRSSTTAASAKPPPSIQAATRSPTCSDSTPGPVCSMIPATSWPIAAGSLSGALPVQRSISEVHRPHCSMRINAWPAPSGGSVRSINSTRNGSCNTAAFIGPPRVPEARTPIKALLYDRLSMAGAGAVLFGRALEPERLTDAIAAACAGSGRLVVVEGPAGIGKSALLDHARRFSSRNVGW